MRVSHLVFALLALPLLGLGACSSGNDESSRSPAASPAPSGDPNAPDGSSVAPEAPLKARATCGVVAIGTKFGESCSGSGSGKALCALEDARCDTDACVYDNRGSFYSFYCATKCTVGDTAQRCPAGYECTAQTGACAGTEGLCANRPGSGCDQGVTLERSTVGTFFEGPAGELYRLAGPYSTGRVTLSVRQGKTFEAVTSFDGDATILGLARSGDSVLLGTRTDEVLIKGGKATSTKKVAASSGTNEPSYGVTKDGAFVMLQLVSTNVDSFAALSRRNDDGTYTEVGPTRQRISRLTPLGVGFLALCQKSLCSSIDGETFTPIALPPNVSLEATTTGSSTPATKLFMATGPSVEDFHFTIDGSVFHQRKGAWVQEGPHADPATPVVDGGSPSNPSSRPDLLRSFVDGTVVFQTWSKTRNRYATFISGDECWSTTGGDLNFDDADLVKTKGENTFVFASIQSQLCVISTK